MTAIKAPPLREQVDFQNIARALKAKFNYSSGMLADMLGISEGTIEGLCRSKPYGRGLSHRIAIVLIEAAQLNLPDSLLIECRVKPLEIFP